MFGRAKAYESMNAECYGSFEPSNFAANNVNATINMRGGDVSL